SRQLRWGRGCSPRKGGTHVYHWLTASAASMGPRLFTAEGLTRRGARPQVSRRFNGAAAVHRGRAVHRPREPRENENASMGPRLFTAEGGGVRQRRDGAEPASMGPRLFTAEGLCVG